MTLVRDKDGWPVAGTLGDLLDAARGPHPLAHQDGIAAFGIMLTLAQERVGVKCKSACGWKGYRKGGDLFATDKPCPRCGAPVVIASHPQRKPADEETARRLDELFEEPLKDHQEG